MASIALDVSQILQLINCIIRVDNLNAFLVCEIVIFHSYSIITDSSKYIFSMVVYIVLSPPETLHKYTMGICDRNVQFTPDTHEIFMQWCERQDFLSDHNLCSRFHFVASKLVLCFRKMEMHCYFGKRCWCPYSVNATGIEFCR